MYVQNLVIFFFYNDTTNNQFFSMTVQRQRRSKAALPLWVLIFVCLLCVCPLPSAGLALPSVSTRSTIPQTEQQQPQSQSQSQSHSPPPPPPRPPWSFDVKRIYYDFRAIPVDQAGQYCPPIIHQQRKKQDGNLSSSNYQPPPTAMMMLSVGGYTLGGIFCVEYESSPVGPYREVAILSSLLVGFSSSGLLLPKIGAWASHIFVDSQDAQTYGEEFWGLPAQYLENIDFVSDSNDSSIDGSLDSSGSRSDSSNAGSLVLDRDNQRIGVSRWGCSNDAMAEVSFPLKISLPSFSGLLPKGSKSSLSGVDKQEDEYECIAPLLQYPLTIQFPRTKASKIGWTQTKTIEYPAATKTSKKNTDVSGSNITASFMDEIQMLLQNSRSLGAVSVENIQLNAGIPEILS